MFKGIKKMFLYVGVTLVLLYLLDAATGGDVVHLLIQHAQIFFHHAQIHGPKLRSPVGH